MDFDNAAPYTHAEGRHVELRGTRLWVETEGAGAPLLLIPGGPGASHTYMHMFRPLRAVRTLVYFDPRGCGRSSGYADPDELRLASAVEDLEALRAKLGFETWDVLGHSWGTFPALAYALKYPSRVRRLVVSNGFVSGRDWEEAIDAANAQVEQLFPELWQEVQRLRRAGHRARSAEMLKAFNVEPDFLYHRAPATAAKTVFEINLDVCTALYGEDCDFGLDCHSDELCFEHRLGELTMPVLVVGGRYDRLVSPKWVIRFKHVLPRAEVRFMEQSGHLPYLEEPEATFKLVTDFLVEQPAARTVG